MTVEFFSFNEETVLRIFFQYPEFHQITARIKLKENDVHIIQSFTLCLLR